jgi:hypothetical protein
LECFSAKLLPVGPFASLRFSTLELFGSPFVWFGGGLPRTVPAILVLRGVDGLPLPFGVGGGGISIYRRDDGDVLPCPNKDNQTSATFVCNLWIPPPPLYANFSGAFGRSSVPLFVPPPSFVVDGDFPNVPVPPPSVSSNGFSALCGLALLSSPWSYFSPSPSPRCCFGGGGSTRGADGAWLSGCCRTLETSRGGV